MIIMVYQFSCLNDKEMKLNNIKCFDCDKGNYELVERDDYYNDDNDNLVLVPNIPSWKCNYCHHICLPESSMTYVEKYLEEKDSSKN